GVEPAGVEGVGIELEDVASRAIGQGLTIRSEQLAELRYVRLDSRLRPLRRVLAPYGLDDPRGRLRFSGVGEEIREETASLRTVDVDRLAVRPHGQRSKHPELHSHEGAPPANRVIVWRRSPGGPSSCPEQSLTRVQRALTHTCWSHVGNGNGLRSSRPE